jgi:hypothetical protein
MTPSASTQQVINDGQIQYGSMTIQIVYSVSPGSTAISAFATVRGTYILEDFTVNRPTKLLRQRDEIGAPRGQVLVSDFTDGTATLQLNDSAANNPQKGDVFSLTLETEIGIEYWIIGALGAPYKQEDYWKRTLTLHKAVNPTVVPNFTPK